MRTGWQLLERPAKHEVITSALSDSETSGVVITGPAGVGKTTLARSVTASLPGQCPVGRVHVVVQQHPARRVRPVGQAHRCP